MNNVSLKYDNIHLCWPINDICLYSKCFLIRLWYIYCNIPINIYPQFTQSYLFPLTCGRYSFCRCLIYRPSKVVDVTRAIVDQSLASPVVLQQTHIVQSKVHTPKLIKMLTQINTNDVLITKGSPFVSPEEIVDNAPGFNALLPSLLYDVGWPLNALWCFLREHLHTVQWFTPTTTFGRSHWVGLSRN